METLTINGVNHDLRKSSTDCGNLDLLFHATGQAVLDNEKGYLIPGVDAEALHKLEDIVDGIRLWANSSNGAIGALMAHVDHKELNGHDLHSIGWLLTGLSELQNALSDAESIIQQTKSQAS